MQTPIASRKLYALDRPIESFFGIDNHYDATIYWKYNDGIYLGCNHFQATLLGADQSKFSGKNIDDFYTQKCANPIKRNDSIVVSSQSTHAFIETSKCNLKQTYSFLSLKTPLKDSANHNLGIFGVSFILKDNLKLDLNLVKPFLTNCDVYNLAQSYPALNMLLGNNITQREAETLYYFIRCKTIKGITTQMKNLTSRTVEYHLNNCKKKLGARTINETLALLWDKNFAYLTLENIYGLFL
jgi:DNA-binding CsgD family transcriptional regulator